ncbi:1,4-beta-xylanase [Paenibacillus pectinilyticus]|uniref:Beta-xylanase n=1 Tax=Paenibacillus pectinilyticus TaxID=512399 RepID=A0A1C1A485_9BACL|nr:endo-1,4-beta-xylanase [Paenibacillus pectinilyticus]OCT15369.1 1,4-beta-xylanase [Paenibacillus pectinilyticus]
MNREPLSLYQAFQGQFKIGAAVSTATLRSSGDFIAKHYNSITAENQMKFEHVQPQEGLYTFEAADAIFDFAASHGIAVRGHTLVWHNQTPDWVFEGPDGGPASKELLLSRLKAHIHTVVGRYKGRVYAWDVVNEAIEDKQDLVMRNTKWLELIGEDYLRHAFQMAHEADPKALLFYNDYNEITPVKRDKIYNLVRSLLNQDVPIHGIGMQAHWSIYGPPLEEIKQAIELYASLGVQLHITEMDLSMFVHEDTRTDLLAPTEQMLELQQQRYEDIFRLLRSYSDVLTSVTFWGAADDHTWLDQFPVRGRKNWPLLFQEDHTPKPAYWRLIEKS